LDEIQKLPGWSEAVKRLWDEDVRTGPPLRVVILGSAALTIQQGLSDSLAGRFETIRLPQWSLGEMRDAFGVTIDEYIAYGGYPGAASLATRPTRWRRYVRDSLIETTIARDVLLMTRVDKPVLLRRLFDLACRYSGQILSYTKMLGQLQDAGNTTTLAHYLDLLDGAGMVTGLPKFAGQAVRSRGSSPKLQVHDTGLLTAQSGIDLREARRDPEAWGRLVESAVGAHLLRAAATGAVELFYWRDRDREVDFVLRGPSGIAAIEVKSGRARHARVGTDAFRQAFGPARPLLIGGDGLSIETFLTTDPLDLV
ncbi:MAG: ATP-binding protein, partial [Chloroflexota bacterium]